VEMSAEDAACLTHHLPGAGPRSISKAGLSSVSRGAAGAVLGGSRAVCPKSRSDIRL
jgi:hypothetical protein